MAEKTIDLSVAMEIVDVINKFEYTRWPEKLTWLDQVRQDIGQSVVLFLSGRAENIYPVEPGVFVPGEVQSSSERKVRIVNYEGRGADHDARER